MEIKVVNVANVQFVKSERKNRTSKYSSVLEAFNGLSKDQCIQVSCDSGESPEALKSRLYQAITSQMNKLEKKDKFEVRILDDKSGVALIKS
jgi:hypothetical protein